jgi:hypothetical protein
MEVVVDILVVVVKDIHVTQFIHMSIVYMISTFFNVTIIFLLINLDLKIKCFLVFITHLTHNIEICKLIFICINLKGLCTVKGRLK